MTISHNNQELKIAIVGGGVCGLTCAVALAKKGVKVDLYEAAPEFGEIGAGIGLGVNAIRIFEEIGVWKDVLTKANEPGPNMDGFAFLSGMQGHKSIFTYPSTSADAGAGIHRAAILNALVQHLDPSVTKLNKRCTSISPSTKNPDRSVIHFADGTTAEADVVLGADGVKSVVRGAVTGHDPAKNIAFSNSVAYRGLISTVDAHAAGVKLKFTPEPVCYTGKDKHLIVFGIEGGSAINVVAFCSDHSTKIGERDFPHGDSWVTPVSQEQMMQEYAGWGNDVVGLLKCIREPSKWCIPVVYPALDTYVKGRIALVGDSAHGMLPHLGSGAGQCLEDAFVLAELLAHPGTNASNIKEVFKAYDAVRRPRAQMVWEESTRAGDIYEEAGPSGGSPEGMRKDLAGIWDKIWHHGVHEDFEDAVNHLKETGTFKN